MDAVQADVLAAEDDGLGRFPELAQGFDKFFGALVARVVIDVLAHLFELALDAAGHDVDVHPPVADLTEGSGHLGEQAPGTTDVGYSGTLVND